MSSTAVDTSVLVAAVQGWHEHHGRARPALEAALEESPLVAQHVLVESYSVLTRLPAPHRLAPPVALEVLSATLKDQSRIVGLESDETWDFLESLPATDVTGGSTYDAFIIRSLVRSGARRILTLNRRHFERLAPPELEVVVP